MKMIHALMTATTLAATLVNSSLAFAERGPCDVEHDASCQL
jgi:hypothetical protein